MSCADSGFKERAGSTSQHCNYCGSISVADAIRLLQKPGTRFSGSDWKYGWPHKFYIEAEGAIKFYAKHLAQASDAELAEFDRLSRKTFGIAWKRDENGVAFYSPRGGSYGWQLSGTIGEDGQPIHEEWLKLDAAKLAEMMSHAFGEAA